MTLGDLALWFSEQIADSNPPYVLYMYEDAMAPAPRFSVEKLLGPLSDLMERLTDCKYCGNTQTNPVLPIFRKYV